MKKLLILFLSLFLFTSQAHALLLGPAKWAVKKAAEKVQKSEKERLKKEFVKKMTKPKQGQ